jgi:hypothetical protein
MNIPYELAVELKEAGFPQEGDFWWSKDEHGRAGWDIYYRDESLGAEEWFSLDKNEHILAPSLSELIEACGGKKIILWEENGWYATMYGEEEYVSGKCIDDTFYDAQEGPTPEEAVARLWLALNKK